MPRSRHTDFVHQRFHVNCLRHNDLFHDHRGRRYRLLDSLGIRLQCCPILVVKHVLRGCVFKLIQLECILIVCSSIEQFFLLSSGLLKCLIVIGLFDLKSHCCGILVDSIIEFQQLCCGLKLKLLCLLIRGSFVDIEPKQLGCTI